MNVKCKGHLHPGWGNLEKGWKTRKIATGLGEEMKCSVSVCGCGS